jgi:hypothetical protein
MHNIEINMHALAWAENFGHDCSYPMKPLGKPCPAVATAAVSTPQLPSRIGAANSAKDLINAGLNITKASKANPEGNLATARCRDARASSCGGLQVAVAQHLLQDSHTQHAATAIRQIQFPVSTLPQLQLHRQSRVYVQLDPSCLVCRCPLQ